MVLTSGKKGYQSASLMPNVHFSWLPAQGMLEDFTEGILNLKIRVSVQVEVKTGKSNIQTNLNDTGIEFSIPVTSSHSQGLVLKALGHAKLSSL